MPTCAANLGFLFQDSALLERFAAAAGVGFRGVERPFPYDQPPDILASRLQANDLTQVLCNMSPGDWAAGERGYATLVSVAQT